MMPADDIRWRLPVAERRRRLCRSRQIPYYEERASELLGKTELRFAPVEDVVRESEFHLRSRPDPHEPEYEGTTLLVIEVFGEDNVHDVSSSLDGINYGVAGARSGCAPAPDRGYNANVVAMPWESRRSRGTATSSVRRPVPRHID
jgi:hypothetical protein